MKYLLDFDDVLFDTKAFKVWLQEHGLSGPRDRSLIEKLQAAVSSRELDMKQFVFEDALSFLENNANNSTVVSSYVSKKDGNNEASEEDAYAFQELKLQMSGVAKMIDDNYVLVGESKFAAIEELVTSTPEETFVFVDDKAIHLQEVMDLDRLTVVLLIRPEGTGGLADYNEPMEFNKIASLSQLSEINFDNKNLN